jgi:hypothetical protein
VPPQLTFSTDILNAAGLAQVPIVDHGGGGGGGAGESFLRV